MGKLTDKRAKEYAESIINKKTFRGKEHDEVTCMWFVNDKRHCKMTSLDCCRGCRFYSPVMREKLRLLAEYGMECEEQAKKMSEKLKDAEKTISNLDDQIDNLLFRHHWIQTSESLPRTGEMVLIQNSRMRCGVYRMDENGAWLDYDGAYQTDGVVAWMPIPDPLEVFR